MESQWSAARKRRARCGEHAWEVFPKDLCASPPDSRSSALFGVRFSEVTVVSARVRLRWGFAPQTPAGLRPAPAKGDDPLWNPLLPAALLAALSFLQKRSTGVEPPPRRRGLRGKAHSVSAIGSRRDHRAAEPVCSSAAATAAGSASAAATECRLSLLSRWCGRGGRGGGSLCRRRGSRCRE